MCRRQSNSPDDLTEIGERRGIVGCAGYGSRGGGSLCSTDRMEPMDS